ncbi:MAG: hypothetical protein KDH95_05185 [Calditrichaeota bacterium]|nr:hypothetical protein [Calditrichota bacterium]MCB0267541.1 hypothetical protein [Calditrichota bacterium]
MKSTERINNSPVTIEPFIYKIYPEDYISLVQATINNPDLFRDIRQFREQIFCAENDAAAYQFGKSQLCEYQLLLRRWRETDVPEHQFRETATQILNELENYHYFFKEMGAALKFSPLSKRHSGTELRNRLLMLLESHLPKICPKALLLSFDAIIGKNDIAIKFTDTVFHSRKLADFFSAPFDPETNLHSGIKSETINVRKQNVSNDLAMVLYLVTIGPGIDETVKLLMSDGDVFDAYLLNGIGGGAAEMVAFDLNLWVNDRFGDAKTPARYQRFSPGYGDWPVSDQRIIFSLLSPEEHIGVRLTEGDIMIPEKSTSGIMGAKIILEKST